MDKSLIETSPCTIKVMIIGRLLYGLVLYLDLGGIPKEWQNADIDHSRDIYITNQRYVNVY